MKNILLKQKFGFELLFMDLEIDIWQNRKFTILMKNIKNT